MINVLITGSGSVMGQSLFRALARSDYRDRLNVYYTNSEPDGAAFFLNSRAAGDLKIQGAYLVPIAKDADYLPTLRRICAERSIQVVFGGTEHEIYALARLQEEPGFENRVASLPTPIVDLTTDKLKTGEFLARHGIPAARTASCENAEEFLRSVPGPYVIKPRRSSASRNIFVVKNAAELADRLFDRPENIVLQEHVGSAEDEFTVGCYLDKISGEVSSIAMRRQLAPDGASISGTVVDNSAIADYCLSIVRALQAEGMRFGAVNIQLRLHNGEPRCFEINGRFSSTEGPRAALGFNAPEAALENLVFQRPYRRFRPQMGMRFLRYYEEVYYSSEERQRLVAAKFLESPATPAP